MYRIEVQNTAQLDSENDFIYNRFSEIYTDGVEYLHLTDANGSAYVIPSQIDGVIAQLGLWLSPTPPDAVEAATKYLFETNALMQRIEYQNYLHKMGNEGGASHPEIIGRSCCRKRQMRFGADYLQRSDITSSAKNDWHKSKSVHM